MGRKGWRSILRRSKLCELAKHAAQDASYEL